MSGVVGSSAPSDAILLFDGQDMDAWQNARTGDAAAWAVEDGIVTVVPGTGSIRTRQTFGDIQLHLEWRPNPVIDGEGQSRGNSGVFLHSQFEVQILDSWENPTYVNGQAGAVYLQHAPLVNVARPPGEWQTYDILFEAPEFNNSGDLVKPAYITLIHNGVLVQNHVEVEGATYTPNPEYNPRCTPWGWNDEARDCDGEMPITLQDHGQIVSFRNIWVREL